MVSESGHVAPALKTAHRAISSAGGAAVEALRAMNALNTSEDHGAIAGAAGALQRHDRKYAQHLHLHNASSLALHGHNGTLSEQDEDRLSPMAAVLLLYSVLFLMIGFQAGLFMWKQKHKRSYELVTLMGLWLMPLVISMQLHFWRFLGVWTLFSAATLYLLSLCLVKKLESGTPRKVYTFFIAVYHVSRTIGVAGYVMLLSEVLGLGPVLRMLLPRDAAVDLLWYGLYFGILGRDCAEVAADRMAAGLGGGGGGAGGGGAGRRSLVSSVNACGVCGNHLNDFSHLGEAKASEEVVQLSCKHCFHDLCIRGWTLVGKKDMCPVCNEKVDLGKVFASRPWETTNVQWVQMLDGVRYLVVWMPIIFMVLSVLFHLFAPHHHHHQHGAPGHLGVAHGPLGALALNASHAAPAHTATATLHSMHSSS